MKINLDNYINPYSQVLYSSIYNSSTYQEKFLVKTYTVGTRIYNLTLDYGVIDTRYKFYNDTTKVALYSASLAFKKLLFNFALRNEESSNMDIYKNGLIINRKKSNRYYGIDYLVNKYLVTGVQYNYFLLDEVSAKLTLFF